MTSRDFILDNEGTHREPPCGCRESWLPGAGCDGKGYTYRLLPCLEHGEQHDEFRARLEQLAQRAEELK